MLRGNYEENRDSLPYGIDVISCRGSRRDTEGYYISYRGIKGVREGSAVLTYLVYGKGNNEPDDIIARHDVVLKR